MLNFVKRSNLVCGLFFLSLFLAKSATAAELKISASEAMRPTGKPNTFDGQTVIQIVSGALDKIGWRYSFVFAPSKRAYLMAKNTQVDATIPRYKTAAGESEMLYSDPIFILEHTAYVRAGSLMGASEIDDLRGARYCLPLGSSLTEPMRTMIDQGNLTIERPESYPDCYKMIHVGRADFTTTDPRAAVTFTKLAGLPLSDFRRLPNPIHSRTLHLVVSREHKNGAHVISEFNRGLQLYHSENIEEPDGS
ncbi:Bacterial extracellular solute-binding proteins, family 3 [Roseibium alexandrii]|uniref:Bacterial extracellular solute-binding proteins, family 3 n=1 Tax=Roseibium alexandrii TaxID=388408 RepID=A0A0M6ZUL0_9HYPH|nr:Bacterial extracellular solute-binding proteins, family 3 [Roseibium alexandrii]